MNMLAVKPPFMRRVSWISRLSILLQAFCTLTESVLAQMTTPTRPPVSPGYYSWQSSPAEGFTIYIRKASTAGMADITLLSTTHSLGWIGFGFGSSMEDADIMMCWSNGDASRVIVTQKLGYSGGVQPVQTSVLTPNMRDSRLFTTQNGVGSTYLSCRFTRPIPNPYPRSFIWASSSSRPISESAIGMHEFNGVFASEFLSPASLNALASIPESNATTTKSSAAPAPKVAGSAIKKTNQTEQVGPSSFASSNQIPYLSFCTLFMLLNFIL